jgi:uncharacterized damage-inducible protein DinB
MTDLTAVKGMLDRNAQLFEKVTTAVPTELWLSRPGDSSNHLTWITGHVVVHRARISKLLGSTWSAPWEALFVRGAALEESAKYPSPSELQQAWKQVSEGLATSLSNASPETLSKPLNNPSPSLDGTVGGLVAFLCFHETYHVGQMGFLKKLLGCGQTVG